MPESSHGYWGFASRGAAAPTRGIGAKLRRLGPTLAGLPFRAASQSSDLRGLENVTTPTVGTTSERAGDAR
jgi:hypothetical protein